MRERGYTKIIDRKKDKIIVSGFNVYANELKNVIALCPGAFECAAIGIADASQGEAIRVIVLKNDLTWSEDDLVLTANCKLRLTGHQRSKYIEFRNDLLKSNVGEILKRELRASN